LTYGPLRSRDLPTKRRGIAQIPEKRSTKLPELPDARPTGGDARGQTYARCHRQHLPREMKALENLQWEATAYAGQKILSWRIQHVRAGSSLEVHKATARSPMQEPCRECLIRKPDYLGPAAAVV